MNGARNKQRKHLILLSTLAVGMLGFSFALVPLYEVFCEITGINGKNYQRVAEPATTRDAADSTGREVTIQFLAKVGTGIPWEFRPTEHQMSTRLGEFRTTEFYARNRAGHTTTGQAVPSVSPGYASKYLHKVQCFCFNQQRLEAGEDQPMPVRFYIAEDLPDEIHTITLSYTLFMVPEDKVAQQVPGEDTELASLP